MSEDAPTSKHDRAPGILTAIITIGYFAVLAFVLLIPIPKESERVIDMMLGTLTTVWIMAVSYFFGTTAGSKQKTELLAQAAPIEQNRKGDL